MSSGDVTSEPMQARASASHDTRSTEHTIGNPAGATGGVSSRRQHFELGGPTPPVVDVAAPEERRPTASELAYGTLEEVLDRTSAIVGSASVQAIATLVEKHPHVSAPILTAVEHTQGGSVARAVSEELAISSGATGDRVADPRVRSPAPTRVAEAPVPMERRRQVAGFEQIARSHVREAGAPDAIELPASLVDALEHAWRDSDASQVETGGNVVRTYGGKYKLRRGEPGDGGMFEPNEHDVGWGETKVGIAHTHPYRKEGYDHGTFSPADLANMVDEDQPLKLLRSGPLTYVIARTKEFDALVERHEKEQRPDALKRAMMKSFDDAFDAAPGAFPDRLEAGVIAVCKQFHLVYYEGRGAELHRVQGPSLR
jgi:hypothetical protein